MLLAAPQSNLEGKVLMIPVSCPEGTGEYMRSLIIAEGIHKQFPNVDIQFVLNKHAPYAAHCPFPTHLLNSSATKEKAAVNALLAELKPNLVIFDCSGRAEQVRQAKKLGAKIIFISQHKKKRNKGFALNRLPALDAHWITQFKFVDGDLTWQEQLKLKLFNKKAPLFTGPIFTPPSHTLPPNFTHLANKPFSLWAAGGGGHKFEGKSATSVFYEAACKVASAEHPAILIAGSNFTEQLESTPHVLVIKSVVNSQLMTLLNSASVVISGGGDFMGQAIVLGRNVVAVPVAKDQPSRVASCYSHLLIRKAPLDTNHIIEQYQAALNNPLKRFEQTESGLQLALNDIHSLLQMNKSVQPTVRAQGIKS